MLWVKCKSEAEKEKAITTLRGLGIEGLKAGPDRALEDRAVGSLLLGLKRQLVAWGFARTDVRVDLEAAPAEFKVGGKVVLKAQAGQGKLATEWVDQSCALWTDLQESKEYKAKAEAKAEAEAEAKAEKTKFRCKGEQTSKMDPKTCWCSTLMKT